MNYGLPYMGSKSTIAYKIIDYLPKAENFYDLFCGGCSITHCAMLSKKWKNIIFNDIDKGMPQLFLDAIRGKYKKENRWISREDFERLKDNAYIRCVWSFGNKGTNYLYGKDIEPYKKAYWYAVMFCAIGDEEVDGKPYSEIVEIARNYINHIGGFEKLAEWGLY